MVFKLRTAFFSLIFSVCLLIPILRASELAVPLPKDTLKVSENSADLGPIKSVTRIYQSSLTQAAVEAFYKQEMRRAGWTLGRDGVFIKNNYMVVITFSPLKDEAGKINFSSTISKIPAKEEFLALPKTQPKKLSFMPVYPGSVQLFLWETPIGVAGSYETEGSIKEVVFFYKSGMLNYGWSLDNATPIKAGAADCPECGKAGQGASNAAGSQTASAESTASLTFRRKDGESCKIIISNIAVDSGNLPAGGKPNNGQNASLPKKTTISVDYNAYQGIK